MRRFRAVAVATAVFLSLVCASARPESESPSFRGEPVEAWVSRLKHADAAVRLAACKELMSPAKEVEPDENVCRLLANGLAPLFDDHDADIRLQAVFAWTRFASRLPNRQPHAAKALALLLGACADDDADIRLRAASALASVEPDAKVVLAPLVRLMADQGAGVRATAARALGYIAPPEAALPALIGALDDQDADVRRAAADSITSIGPAVRSATTRLVLLLDDPIEEVQNSAVEAIGKASLPEVGVPALIARYERATVNNRKAMLQALANLAPEDTRVRALLLAGLADDSVRGKALSILSSESKRDPNSWMAEAVPALLSIAGDDTCSQAMRVTSLFTLGRLGPAAAAAVPGLEKLREDASVGKTVEKVIRQIDASHAGQ
jgi:HEAT repeat protein